MPSPLLALLLAVQEPPPPAEPPPPPIVAIPPPPVIRAPPPRINPVFSPYPAPPPPPNAIRPPVHVSGTITNDDYPAAAIRAEQEGTVTVRLTVAAEGRPESCDLIRSSGSAVLDSTTCALLMRRARFSPARDDQGRPVRGSVSRTVRWELPDGPTIPRFVSGRVASTVLPGGLRRCAGAVTPFDLRPISSDLCAELFPTPLTAAAAAERDRQPVLAMLSISTSGEVPPLPHEPGRLAYREEASFEVEPTGTVINCRKTVTHNRREESVFDLCRYLATEDGPFFAGDNSATAARPGRMTLEIYEISEPVTADTLMPLFD